MATTFSQKSRATQKTAMILAGKIAAANVDTAIVNALQPV